MDDLVCPICAFPMKEPKKKDARKQNLSSLIVILGVCISILLGLIVGAFMQSGAAAIGGFAVGLFFTFLFAI